MKIFIEAEGENLQADIQGKSGEIISALVTVMEKDKKLERLFEEAVRFHADDKQQAGLRITASEALYGFVAWLTTRKEIVTLSSAHQVERVANLVDLFCKANDLNSPRDCYPENIARMNEKGQGECRGCGKIHD